MQTTSLSDIQVEYEEQERKRLRNRLRRAEIFVADAQRELVVLRSHLYFRKREGDEMRSIKTKLQSTLLVRLRMHASAKCTG